MTMLRHTFLVPIIACLAAAVATADTPLPQWGQLDGFVHLRAYQTAYPDRVQSVAYRDGDWAILVNDTWFYWANGRILPEKARASWELYAPARLYRYRTGVYTVPPVDAGEEEILEAWIHRDPATVPRRHNGFLGVLYGALSSGQARQIMQTVDLFGHRVRVHPLLVEPLERVRRQTKKAMLHNPELIRFVNGLVQIDGQNWREIAGTRSLSYHSYGVAIDMIPSSYRGGFSYWRWAAEAGIVRWWALPPSQRWLLPPDLVEIFEQNGFVCGGRWLFFDAIHMEYRPEIFAVNRTLEQDRANAALPRSSPGR